MPSTSSAATRCAFPLREALSATRPLRLRHSISPRMSVTRSSPRCRRLYEWGCHPFLLAYLTRWDLFGLTAAVYSERIRRRATQALVAISPAISYNCFCEADHHTAAMVARSAAMRAHRASLLRAALDQRSGITLLVRPLLIEYEAVMTRIEHSSSAVSRLRNRVFSTPLPQWRSQ